MKYAGLIKQSLVDYPGEIAAVLFTRGCNFRCPFCHNVHLLAEEKRGPGAENSLQAGGEKDNIGDGKTYDIESILEFLRERRKRKKYDFSSSCKGNGKNEKVCKLAD